MDKLELKHLCGYLPYGLQIEILNYKSDYTGVQYGVVNGYYILDDQPHFTYIGGDTGKSFSEFKPILRPLSDLTTEIEVNGEKFVPIQLMFYVENQGIEFRYDVKGMVPAIKRTILYGKHEDFDGEEEIGYISHNYKNMFGRYLDKLYEWHFDVFGLIDKGLAIDINTLEGGAS